MITDINRKPVWVQSREKFQVATVRAVRVRHYFILNAESLGFTPVGDVVRVDFE